MKLKQTVFLSNALIIANAIALILLTSTPALAANPAYTGDPIMDGIIATIIYSAIGIIMAFISYKVIDLITPGDLGRDIAENSIALAILTGLTVLGVCIIIAAAIAG